jgi:DNA-binding transcriptional ArsR family regulator
MEHAKEIIHEPEIAERLAEVLKALAHPLRLRLVASLCQEERNVQELCALLEARQALVSQHLSVLRMVGLVAAERSGGTATYSIKEPGLRNLVKCLTGCQGR